MSISVFDIFTVGIGPSSSHTVGPMRAAKQFIDSFDQPQLQRIANITVELYGSLGATGKGHGTGKAVIMGLQGETPEQVAVDSMAERIEAIQQQQRLPLPGQHSIAFNDREAIIFHRRGYCHAV